MIVSHRRVSWLWQPWHNRYSETKSYLRMFLTFFYGRSPVLSPHGGHLAGIVPEENLPSRQGGQRPCSASHWPDRSCYLLCRSGWPPLFRRRPKTAPARQWPAVRPYNRRLRPRHQAARLRNPEFPGRQEPSRPAAAALPAEAEWELSATSASAPSPSRRRRRSATTPLHAPLITTWASFGTTRTTTTRTTIGRPRVVRGRNVPANPTCGRRPTWPIRPF